jgi:hypothetical protein
VGDLSPADHGGLELRVGDVERGRVVDQLRTHYAAGRLDLADFETRTTAALAARTRGDLVPLLADLPIETRGRTAGPPARERHGTTALEAYLRFWIPLSVMFIIIWALSDFGGYFWPAWPMFGTGIPMLFMLSGHRGHR